MRTYDTALTRHAHIEVPIICGAMYPCSNPELVAAVSEAGGIGIVQPISLTYVHGHDYREGLRLIRRLTSKPVGMNALIEASSKSYHERMIRWVNVALEEGIRFFVTSLGNPKWVVEAAKPFGGIVYHDVTERKWAEKGLAGGVHGLIAVNSRAGGHAGPKTPEQLMEELGPLGAPLVCAGGIGTPAEFHHALSLGYAGVQLGTRFIATTECRASEAYKQAILARGGEGHRPERAHHRRAGRRDQHAVHPAHGPQGRPDRALDAARPPSQEAHALHIWAEVALAAEARLARRDRREGLLAGGQDRRGDRHASNPRATSSVGSPGTAVDCTTASWTAASPAAMQDATFGRSRGHSRHPPPGVSRESPLPLCPPFALRLWPFARASPDACDAEEIRLARSAAPAEVSAHATVLVLRDGKYVEGERGSNGVTCYVSRSQPQAIEPECFDAEAVETVMPIDILQTELRLAGKTSEEVDRIVAGKIASGEFKLRAGPRWST